MVVVLIPCSLLVMALSLNHIVIEYDNLLLLSSFLCYVILQEMIKLSYITCANELDYDMLSTINYSSHVNNLKN